MADKSYYLSPIFEKICAYCRRIALPVSYEMRSVRLPCVRATVFLRSRPGSVPLHPRLLPDRSTSLPASGVRRRVRRGAGVLRNTSGRDRRLLLRRVSRPETRQSGTTRRRSAGRYVCTPSWTKLYNQHVANTRRQAVTMSVVLLFITCSFT